MTNTTPVPKDMKLYNKTKKQVYKRRKFVLNL